MLSWNFHSLGHPSSLGMVYRSHESLRDEKVGGEARRLLTALDLTRFHGVILLDTGSVDPGFREPWPERPHLQSCSSADLLGDSHFSSMGIMTLTSQGCGRLRLKQWGETMP